MSGPPAVINNIINSNNNKKNFERVYLFEIVPHSLNGCDEGSLLIVGIDGGLNRNVILVLHSPHMNTIEVHLFPLSHASDAWFANEPSFVSDGLMQAQTLLSKHMLNDVTLTWDRSQSCIARLLFGEIKPRRLELSPNLHLLLVLGSHYHGALSLVVYRIQPQSPHLVPVFSDSALAVLDAAFAPDSRSLLVIPTASPSHIWIVPLSPDAAPIVEFDPTLSSAPPANASVASFSRLTGSIGVIGPALDCFGYLHEPRHIASYGGVSSYMCPPPPTDDVVANAPQYHLATWGDECDGSFCLWSVWSSDANGASAVPLFRVYPQMLVPSVRNAAWLDDPTTPKNSICMMKFSRTTPELLAVVRRENYRRAQDNGIALQTIRLDDPDGIVMGVSRIVSSAQSSAQAILQATWTLPMLLGTQPCAAVVVEDNGVCEINQQVYGAQFLERHEFFHNSVRCIAQVDRYRRLWLDKHGRLRMLHIEPRQAVPQAHSWGAMFDFGSNDNLPLRLLAAKIGYAIKDHREDASVSLSAKLEAIYTRSVKKAVLSSEPIAPSAVQQGEAFECVHLYRCFNCGEVLLRPLVCSCGTAAFCGRVCQSRQR